jgi:23S rRNA (adenine-N6)-dimethyltransferase
VGHPLRPRIRYSQNFLTDSALIDRLLAASALGPDDLVLDIGAGEGLITERLARQCRKVRSYEIDPGLVHGLLRRFSGFANVVIHAGDFVDSPLPTEPYKVFANIPFNRTADIVRKLTQGPRSPEETYLVMQAEAAERFVGAPHGTLVAAELAPWFAVRVEHHFRRQDFTPAPGVEVVLLRMAKRGPPLIGGDEEQAYRRLTSAVFTAWESTISGALHRLGGRAWANRVLDLAGADGEAAPSEVSPAAWVPLFRAHQRLPSDRVEDRLREAERRRVRQQNGKIKRHRPGMPASGPGPPLQAANSCCERRRCTVMRRRDRVGNTTQR